MRILTTAAFAILIAGSAAGGAKADDPYRWCAENMGGEGATNCYFVTLEQCQAAVSGAGSFCSLNSFYDDPRAEAPRVPKRRR
jgi:uncharacterized membrane protein